MATSAIRARPPNGSGQQLTIVRDRDVLASRLEDASHFPGGHSTELVVPTSEAEIAEAIRTARSVLPIGAQSSLTGGATPFGERLISTHRLNRILSIESDSVRVEAGVTLVELDRALAAAGRCYPPAPTFAGAFVGGTVGTNAAGARTFKYGTTREWVEALTVVLASGDVLDVRRGEVVCDAEGWFSIELSNGTARFHVPTYEMPSVPKVSAGYYARPRMDLVDLFVGSEGTLGVITEVTLRVLPVNPVVCLALVPFPSEPSALEFTRLLRNCASQTWRTHDRDGVDVSAIEYMDKRSLDLLAEDGADRANGVRLPSGTAALLLVTIELPAGTTGGDAYDQLGSAAGTEPRGPLGRFCALLASAEALENVEIALPGDRERAAQLLAVREAVPAAVNRRVGIAKRQVDASIAKTAADVIVPFEQLESLLDVFRDVFEARGLDSAVWGHVSDGNLHANVLPRSVADVMAGQAAMLECGREAIRLGGSPLAEHGVGRNEVKQRLLRELYGDGGIDEMRRVKQAIDPEWKLAPGVLFPREAVDRPSA